MGTSNQLPIRTHINKPPRAVFFVQAGGAAHLVDLLAQTGHQQRHAERLGVAGFQFLVLV